MVNLFQYLKNKKGKNIPLEFKLSYNIPLTDEELIVDADLNLYYSYVTSLPDNLIINGYLNINRLDIIQLPNNLFVKSHLFLDCTSISVLPDDLRVYGNLYCWNTPLAYNIMNDPSLVEKYSKQIKGKIFCA